MYKLGDLDEPIKTMAINLKNLENEKEYFHLAVDKILTQQSKIEDILRCLQKNLTGEPIEVRELVRKINIINELSDKFRDLLNARESQLMNVIVHPISQTLPS